MHETHPMRSIGNAVLALLLSASCLDRAMAAGRACSPTQTDAAEAAADHLTDWARVSAYVQRFQACDDGGTAEASSEAVARLLADRWTTLPELAARIHRQPALRSFVLAHVNSTLDTADLKRILAQARTSCPPSDAGLCRSIEDATLDALR